MKLPKKLLQDNIAYSRGTITHDDLIILVIINLHLDKKINDAKLMAMFKQYNEKTLIRRVKTHHCKINDRWYNDESMFTILMECWDELCTRRDLDLDTCVKYFNLLLNKNKNYCVDHLWFQYIEPIIESFSNYSHEDLTYINALEIDDSGFMSYDKFSDTWQATSGYCCRDCDGCLGEYKSNRYREYLGYNFKEKLITSAKEQLNKMKTSSAEKNPWNNTRVK